MTISVVIPTYNRRYKIGLAIDSVLSQDVAELELLIVDDGSTDGSVEWLGEAYRDPRLKVMRNVRKKGPAGARNTGLLAATGDFVAFLDSDDSFLPGHLSDCLKVFDRFPDVGLIFGKAIYEQNGQQVEYMGPNMERKLSYAETIYADDQLRLFGDDSYTHLLEFGCYFNLSTVVVRSEVARSLMNEDLRIAEDYEFWCRISRIVRFACIEKPQIRYLLHEENISFESSASAANNAPNQIKAYNFLLGYDGLNSFQVKLIRRHLADVYFDWAYRCRMRGLLGESAKRHVQSMQYGKRLDNCLSLLKLAVAPLIGSADRT